MVVVKIGDGLGNQMFNYVCGYAVAKHDGDKLKLDTSDVDNSSFRSYGLDAFNIKFTDRESFSNKTVFHKIYKRLRRNLKYRCIFENEDTFATYDERLFVPKKLRNKYLHGYFQGIDFYLKNRADIDRQFTPSKPLRAEVSQLMEKFSSGDYCTFHVRGGDISPMPLTYYQKAVEYMHSIAPDVKMVVFTNDRKTASAYVKECCDKENIDYEFVWEDGNFTDVEELFLMKSTKYHIISDSTFARWGALLAGDDNTVAPDSVCKSGIYPSSWRTFSS